MCACVRGCGVSVCAYVKGVLGVTASQIRARQGGFPFSARLFVRLLLLLLFCVAVRCAWQNGAKGTAQWEGKKL